MMKTIFTFLLLIFATTTIYAQNFPLPGAKWTFTSDNSAGHPMGEQLEYLGDSIVPNGVIKKMRQTLKLVNPNWYTDGDSTFVFTGIVYYRYSADSVLRIMGNGIEDFICDFSLTTGDSSLTPFYNRANLDLLEPTDVMFCVAADSALLQRKGVVTESGTLTEDGLTYRYYKLLYTDEYGVEDSVTFSERSIITQDYWMRNVEQFCGQTLDPVIIYLMCFSDDSSAVECAEVAWFDHLSLNEQALSWNGELYPNPAAGSVTLSNPAPYTIQVQLSDLNGRTAGPVFEVAANAVYEIDLSLYKNGTYIITLKAEGGVVHKRLVVATR